MPIWQIQIQVIAILNIPHRGLCSKEKQMKYFINVPNVFVIADDILVVGFDIYGKDHDDTLQKILQICRQVNLILNKGKYLFRCSSVSFFTEVISSQGMRFDPQNLKVMMEMSP